ncbi:uncharacterized protein LOC8278535 [Ricinus communis]|uniref:Uncharacterized protein n=1 Tax=Ricinus communis TaxID=3988 RepID=B9RYM6_RICCO|nr:uncharacterized protein LOC8278535 [Ricinus communis]EEF43378.1 hypothetical protein RCOM_1311780 [Ricinus communis]|eukprot:XP_002518845.1 uncharacterized protein LOC8278535 [Ricinus communis]
MGNCSLKSAAEELPSNVRVLTDTGGIIQLRGPKLAKDVLVGHPGYGIFRQGHASSSPLSSHEYLIGGQFYYLLPLRDLPVLCDTMVTSHVHDVGFARKEKNILATESPEVSFETALATQNDEVAGPAVQVLPSQSNGVWKVKLMISPKQLEEILSEERNTEALIEKMRMAAAASSSAASLAPRKSKSSWGVAWKPCISNVFKVSPIDVEANKN